MTAAEGFAVSWAGAAVLVIFGSGALLSALWWLYRRDADQTADLAKFRLDVARDYVAVSKFNRVEARVEATAQEVSRQREVINLLPDKETAHRLELSLEAMRGEVRVLAEQIKPVSAISERLQEIMMERTR